MAKVKDKCIPMSYTGFAFSAHHKKLFPFCFKAAKPSLQRRYNSSSNTNLVILLATGSTRVLLFQYALLF